MGFRKLGAGLVFATGLVLGLAVAGGLVVGSSLDLREGLQPLFAELGASISEIGETPVASAPPFLVVSGPETLLAESSREGSFEASATVVIENPSAFEAQTLRSVDPTKLEEMSRVAQEGLASGDFLAAILDAEDEDITRRDALNAILESFGLDPVDELSLTDELAVSWLGERGLAILAVRDATLESLRGLNHPALLRLRGMDESESRLVALLRLDGELASIHGVIGAGPLWIPIDELAQQWDGDAWIAWNDFESIRPVLSFGEQGHSVTWLQSALGELGYFEGEPSGLFDNATRDGLREFQRERQLLPDGAAGPRTRMMLYDLLERYDVPRLVDAGTGRGAG